MDQQLVSAWLQLPAGNWPPDHYSLLGLPSGEADIARIEQQVYQRMEIARRYQLTHAEPATEVMNRLAQALVCLTDPIAKRAYDAALLPRRKHWLNGQQAPTASAQVKPFEPAPKIDEAHPLESTDRATRRLMDRREGDWQGAPPIAHAHWQSSAPPVRSEFPSPLPNAHRELIETVQQSMLRAPDADVQDAVISEAPAQAPFPASALAAPAMVPGRLRDKRALYAHITKMRRLLWAWQRTGLFLKHEPPRLVNRPADAMEFMGYMRALREALESSPSILGSAGGPGYHILTLARQDDVVPRLKKLAPAQREAVARDWQSGYDFLLENRRVLREQLLKVRHRGLVRKLFHVLGAALVENVGLLILLLAIVTINVSFQHNYPVLRGLRFEQTMLFLALACARLVLWWHSYAPLRGRLHEAPLGERTGVSAARRISRRPHASGTKA